jgi:hypothetical protein
MSSSEHDADNILKTSITRDNQRISASSSKEFRLDTSPNKSQCVVRIIEVG